MSYFSTGDRSFDERGKYGGKRNPWLDSKPNFSPQTGGDWFGVLLRASMDNKPVHGSNTSATCEVLCRLKVPGGISEGIGKIKWDPHQKHAKLIGSDISDRPYNHHQFRGTVTSSGNIMAYESGAWEPSVRARARATSLLAAGIHAHGCHKEEAVKAVSLIASDDVDSEAVESTLVPASHLKREMTIISKANHRIFSRGTLQSGILWDDSLLTLGSNSGNVAFDWGRITAIARYIGEANVQSCPHFRLAAYRQGVPYYIVRNSWAFVASTDYHLYPSLFKNVPKIDIQKYGIPSIKGAFVNHEQDILIAVTRSLDNVSMVPDSDTFRGYQKIYKAAQHRQARRRRMRVERIDDIADVCYTRADEYEEPIGAFIDKSQVPWKSLVNAVATRRLHDPKVQEVALAYEEALKAESVTTDIIDQATIAILDHNTWILARSIAERVRETDIVSPYSDFAGRPISMVMRLAKLKTSMFGYPSHLTTFCYFTASTLFKLRDYTVSLMRESKDGETVSRLDRYSLVSAEFHQTSQIVGELRVLAERHLEHVNTVASKKYKEWSVRLFEDGRKELFQDAVRFTYVSIALKNLSVPECMSKSSSYVDCSHPKHCYIVKAVKKLSKKLGHDITPLRRVMYDSVNQIIEDLLATNSLPYDLGDAVRYTTSVLDVVVGDIMTDHTFTPRQEEFEDLFVGLPVPGSPVYGDGCMEDAEDAAILDALFARHQTHLVKVPSDLYTATLDTYPNVEMAEEYAKANGYMSFKQAFDAIGEGASNIPDYEFVYKAKGALAFTTNDSNLASKKRGYASLI